MPIVTSRKDSDPKATLLWQIDKGLGLQVLPEFKFHPTRKWAFDLALPAWKLAIEIEGGFFLPQGGRHNRGAGARADCEKYSEAAVLGWKLLRVLPEWVGNGKAFDLVVRALKASGAALDGPRDALDEKRGVR